METHRGEGGGEVGGGGGGGGRAVLIGTEDRGQEERKEKGRGAEERQGVLQPSGGSLCLMMRRSRN